MKRYFRLVFILFFGLTLQSWGFYTHRIINQHASYSLPLEMSPFFKRYAYEIQKKSVQADQRVYVDPDEGARHYIHLDNHNNIHDSLIIPWYKLDKHSLQRDLLKQGIIPWQIDLTYRKLVNAFSQKNSAKIIQHASDLGHYMADAHVPLHTSSNYNGQQTNQHGIHALWETRLPEMFIPSYNLIVGKPEYTSDVLHFAWETVRASHALLDSVFYLEWQTSQQIAAYRKRSYIVKNYLLQLDYSDEFCRHYHQAMQGMLERRIKASIRATASLWYSAWIDAGQPMMNELTAGANKINKDWRFSLFIQKGHEDWY
ncbi:hypothetical protein GQF61_13510 [Sphingobacterium sp. DK4209]|uniref:S1/P1 Nuclease n=1 Tax=Sphingobacterium zhuxiongii TaxID=2662364 RepID=A0A5Q0QAA4_9SPHI|nr:MULTISPECIES: zinc dependent phospholipase C family protein [unclassified Sphingobacterium]MVZ66874.1 hypothetical protein [Sphingobacterium sp. DK4209]QGA26204.1 hypothetical protein GFH32_07645 [Sphingobacterium sp. dk4302]